MAIMLSIYDNFILLWRYAVLLMGLVYNTSDSDGRKW